MALKDTCILIVPVGLHCHVGELRAMEIQFTPEQEARLSQIAHYNGTPAEQPVRQAALRLLEEDAQFHADIDEAIKQADRGKLIDHEEVKARIARSLQSR